MAHPTLCPSCLSKYQDIRGLLYAYGSAFGVQCEDGWHRGANYNPDVLVLSDTDRAMLKKAMVKI